MLNKFIVEIVKNMQVYDSSIYMLIIFVFIGTVMAGFCEEIIFRGIILNSFSICNIINIFMGIILWIIIIIEEKRKVTKKTILSK